MALHRKTAAALAQIPLYEASLEEMADYWIELANMLFQRELNARGYKSPNKPSWTHLYDAMKRHQDKHRRKDK